MEGSGASSTVWTETFPALTIGALCPPGIEGVDVYNRPISESCLTINVWAPAPDYPGEKFSVIQWIHGGAFVEGAPLAFGVGNFSLYAVTHRTIIVAASYRFNALGFFSSDLLNGHSEPEARGVFGLLDQRLALQWTQVNVEAFGGLKNQVTIYGQSAGAISVCLQTATPLNDLAGGQLSRTVSLFQWLLLLFACDQQLGNSNMVTTLGCTRSDCLLDASWEAIAASVGSSLLAFQPTVGGNTFLPDQPITLLAERTAAYAAGDRSIFMPDLYARGSVADEGTFLVADLFPGLTGPNDPNGPSQEMIDYIEMGLGNYTTEFYYDQLAQFYSTEYNPTLSSPAQGLIDSTNDAMICNLRRELIYLSRAIPTYGWFFDSAPATAEYPAWVDVFHESDIFYVSKNPDGIWCVNLTDSQLDLGTKMDIYWDAGVTKASLEARDPSDPLNTVPKWVDFSAQNQQMTLPVMHFTAKDEGKGPMQMVAFDSITNHGVYYYYERCNLLDKILAQEYGIPAMDPSTYIPQQKGKH